MRLAKYTKAAIAVCAAATLLGMPTAAQNPKAETGPKAVSTREPATLQAAANMFWDSALAKCGGDYYDDIHEGGSQQRDGIVQWRGVSFHVFPRTLSPAEKLSGSEWQGWAIMTATLFRRFRQPRFSEGNETEKPYNTGHIWFDWEDGKSAAWAKELAQHGGTPNTFLDLGRHLNGSGMFVVVIEKSSGRPVQFYWANPGEIGVEYKGHGNADNLPKKLSCAAIPK
jgi:hypothetical protein